jgi:hypothetical protein
MNFLLCREALASHPCCQVGRDSSAGSPKHHPQQVTCPRYTVHPTDDNDAHLDPMLSMQNRAVGPVADYSIGTRLVAQWDHGSGGGGTGPRQRLTCFARENHTLFRFRIDGTAIPRTVSRSFCKTPPSPLAGLVRADSEMTGGAEQRRIIRQAIGGRRSICGFDGRKGAILKSVEPAGHGHLLDPLGGRRIDCRTDLEASGNKVVVSSKLGVETSPSTYRTRAAILWSAQA